MPTRKTFLKQAGFALAGSCIPFSKLFAKEAARITSPTALDTYHPVKCTFDLATSIPTSYKYTYIEDVNGVPTAASDIIVSYGYYSENGTETNPYCNDVVYDAEGDGTDPSCQVAVSDGCNPYDYDPANSPTYEGKNPFRYKAYYPRETVHNYTTTPLLVYIFFHAGGFQECTTYDSEQLKQICIELSRKGLFALPVNTEGEEFWTPIVHLQIH